VESPDLEEAVKKLKGQVLSVKKFLDGSYHEERLKNERNKVIKVSELKNEIDVLNGQIKVLRARGSKFRAVDLCGGVLGMAATPEYITLRFPSLSVIGDPSVQQYKLYTKEDEVDSLYAGQPMHVRIDADAISVVEEKRPSEKASDVRPFDTLLFLLQTNGKIEMKDFELVFFRNERKEYWSKTLVDRAKKYGFAVRALDDESTYALYLDLPSAGWKRAEGRYLAIRTRGIGDIGNRIDIFFTNDPPSAALPK